MFDSIAPRYDLLNDLLSLGQDRGWRVATTKAIQPVAGEKILDVAAGTGTSSAPLARLGAHVTACDISPGMLQLGASAHEDIDFVVGNALSLPFADETFDAVTCSFGLRNLPDPLLGLTEMRRVCKTGGRIVVCEFSTPTNALLRTGYRWWLADVLPVIARVSSNAASYEYLSDSIKAWPNQSELVELLGEAGWQQVQYRNLTGGIVALHRGLAR